jgi:hypothetical protein
MKRGLTGRRHSAALCVSVLLAIAGVVAGCQIPVLESAECRDAKNYVREFYSFHVGNDMHPSPQGLELRKQFLTPQLANSLASATDEQTDYFTQTVNDYPRAFQVAGCTSKDANSAIVEVLLFWKDDVRTEQRSLSVEVVKSEDRWLVNKVSKN